jgi:hypothetical protein
MHFSSGKVEIEYSVLYPLALLAITWLLWFCWPMFCTGFVEAQCAEIDFCVHKRSASLSSFLSWCWIKNSFIWIGLAMDTVMQLFRCYFGPLGHLIPVVHRYTPCLALYSYSVVVMGVQLALMVSVLSFVWFGVIKLFV